MNTKDIYLGMPIFFEYIMIGDKTEAKIIESKSITTICEDAFKPAVITTKALK